MHAFDHLCVVVTSAAVLRCTCRLGWTTHCVCVEGNVVLMRPSVWSCRDSAWPQRIQSHHLLTRTSWRCLVKAVILGTMQQIVSWLVNTQQGIRHCPRSGLCLASTQGSYISSSKHPPSLYAVSLLQDLLGRGTLWSKRPVFGYLMGGCREAGFGVYARCDNIRKLLKRRWAGMHSPTLNGAVKIMAWLQCCPFCLALHHPSGLHALVCAFTIYSQYLLQGGV